jgi:hypothetical protein
MMTSIRPVAGRARVVLAAAVLAGAFACSSSTPTPSAELQRDLELARGEGLEMAPRGPAQTTVSAVELGGNVKAAPSRTATPVRRTSAASAPTSPAATPVSTPVAEAPAPAPAAADAAPSAARPQAPSSRPAMNPAPPGGYKTMGELIRKAPFPINP